MITIVEQACDFCGACVSVCPPDCIELTEADIDIDHEECIDCMLCVYVCPLEVLKSEDSSTD
ncbi:MAG: 4Fe-4S dicluster domain-containing protein [Candidatus Neomarinimicrobiota bacterium]|nr:MAG: 4Fe-4S dicluster domain-containing protein [Candidatus Neomarinimicrobiota bacterium]